jgi:hypothetical protein
MKSETHAGNVVVIADGFLEETIANFPGEDGRAFAFELRNFADYIVGGHPRFGAANGSRPDRARLVIPENGRFSNVEILGGKFKIFIFSI